MSPAICLYNLYGSHVQICSFGIELAVIDFNTGLILSCHFADAVRANENRRYLLMRGYYALRALVGTPKRASKRHNRKVSEPGTYCRGSTVKCGRVRLPRMKIKGVVEQTRTTMARVSYWNVTMQPKNLNYSIQLNHGEGNNHSFNSTPSISPHNPMRPVRKASGKISRRMKAPRRAFCLCLVSWLRGPPSLGYWFVSFGGSSWSYLLGFSLWLRIPPPDRRRLIGVGSGDGCHRRHLIRIRTMGN